MTINTMANANSAITTNHFHMDTNVPMMPTEAAALLILHIGTGRKEKKKQRE